MSRSPGQRSAIVSRNEPFDIGSSPIHSLVDSSGYSVPEQARALDLTACSSRARSGAWLDAAGKEYRPAWAIASGPLDSAAASVFVMLYRHF